MYKNYKSQELNYKQRGQKLQSPILKFVICILFGICNLLFAYFAPSAHAQTLGLSISPPIDEIMIMPGKEVIQNFTISNDGEDGMASIYLIPFRPQGENGAVTLDESNIVSKSSGYAEWFSIISPVTSFGEKFFIGGGQSKNITIKVSPPKNANEKDYYLTLLYELDNIVPEGQALTGSAGRARIGSNLLISISKDGKPQKSPHIVEFSVPMVMDSLQKLQFKVRIGNDGVYVLKSNGQIIVKPMTGSSQTLSLAPLNVVAGSVRNIPCIEGEEMTSCISKAKVHIGIYKSTLTIAVDGEGAVKEETRTTIAFPFSIVLGVIIVIITYRLIKKTQKHGEEPIDKSFSRLNNGR